MVVKEVAEDRVTCEEQQLMQRKYKIRDWISSVVHMQNSIDEIIKEGEEEIQKKCVRCFFPRDSVDTRKWERT